MRKRKNSNSINTINQNLIYSNFLLLYTIESVKELQDKLTDLENKISDIEETNIAMRIHNLKTEPKQS